MFPLKLTILLVIIVLIIVWLMRKSKGQKGTWDSRQDIEEFATIMNITDSVPLLNSIEKEDKQYHSKLILPIKNNNSESIGESICRKHLEKRLNTKFNRYRPDFLKNPITQSNLELDCFSPQLKLAVEYNGKQHYEFVPKFHRNKNDFYNQKYRDEIKKRLCLENGIDLIEVPYSVPHHSIPTYIDLALQKLGKIKIK